MDARLGGAQRWSGRVEGTRASKAVQACKIGICYTPSLAVNGWPSSSSVRSSMGPCFRSQKCQFGSGTVQSNESVLSSPAICSRFSLWRMPREKSGILLGYATWYDSVNEPRWFQIG